MENLSVQNYKYQNWKSLFTTESVKNLDIRNYVTNSSWDDYFQSDNDDRNEIIDDVNRELRKLVLKDSDVFPYPELMFNALNLTSVEDIVCVILGQDPYINSVVNEEKNKVPEAMGLSFSVPKGHSIPPSLENIFKNMLKNKIITEKPKHGNLSNWAKQGVLMLNASLTVKEKLSNSHKTVWAKFTDNLIEYIMEKQKGIIFVLWGADALKKSSLIDPKIHHMIISSHPSPLGASNKLRQYEAFNDSNPFKEVNDKLKKMNKKIVNWNI